MLQSTLHNISISLQNIILIDVAHHMLSCWSTCAIEVPLRTLLRLMTSPGFDSEKLSGFHVCIFQFIVLTKMQFFFGSMWWLHCSCYFVSWKSFLLGENKISCIHGSFLFSRTLSDLGNSHARPEPFHLKILSDLPVRTHGRWYQVWLNYQLQLNVEDINPLIVIAVVPHAHIYSIDAMFLMW